MESASPAECHLVEDALAASFLDELPARLIGDKAYDSDGLDRKLAAEYGIEMIAPTSFIPIGIETRLKRALLW